MSLALSRTGHIHARVGFSEGPQIPDPLAPEWQHTLEQHLVWWDTVVEAFKRRKEDSVTITAEFGPSAQLGAGSVVGVLFGSRVMDSLIRHA